MVVVGRAREITGFALAGVETLVCEPGDDATALLGNLADPDAGVGLVIVTPSAGRAAAAVIHSLRRRKGPPVIAELPDVDDEAAP
jgi:vacuolar-type H+-ATPase subunit F/Vma7